MSARQILVLVFLSCCFLLGMTFSEDEIEYFQSKEYTGDSRAYTEEDLIPPYIEGQANREETLRYLRLLRNELFARRGFEFKSKDLKEFFRKMKWYKSLYSFYQSVVLNEWEGDNSRLIQKKEIELKASDEAKQKEYSKGYVKTVVETTMGYGPEGLGYRMWEGDPDFPISIVADSKMRIYVLDHLRNRIRVYSEGGEHLSDLKVKVYEEASYEEMMEEANGFAFAILYSKKMFMENDTIHIPVKGGSFGNKKLEKIIKIYPKNDSSWIIEEFKEGELLKEGRFNEKIAKVDGLEVEATFDDQLIIRDIEKGSENRIELPNYLQKVFIDNDKNIFGTGFWGNYNDYPQLYGVVRKYSKEGELLKELKIPFSLDSPFVDKEGNVFAMQRVPEHKEYGAYVDPGVIKITIWK
jgi:hypothetical protein